MKLFSQRHAINQAHLDKDIKYAGDIGYNKVQGLVDAIVCRGYIRTSARYSVALKRVTRTIVYRLADIPVGAANKDKGKA